VVTQTYRCLNCLDATVDRGYNVSHIKVTCEDCAEFGRFVHDGVYQQYQDFEDEPPDGLNWETLSRIEKFMVAEKMVREGKSIDDFEIERDGDAADEADV
jgi:late competence protein required for DNA uptake (superfamily II DNA/RNA helicase)